MATISSTSRTPMTFLRRDFRQQHLGGADFVDDVDRLVRQLAVVDVFRGQLDGRLDGFRRVTNLVVVLEIGLQAFQNLDGVRHARLAHVDLLKTADQRPVLLEILPVFLVGRRTDAPQRSGLKRGLEKVRCIHRAAAGGPGADNGMDFVDEEDGAGDRLQLLDHGFQPLLEISAVARSRDERAHVERVDRAGAQNLGHVGLHDLARQSLGDCGLADSWIAHEEGIVLLPAAENLDRALDFGIAPDQRIDAAGLGLLVEIDAIRLESVAAVL